MNFMWSHDMYFPKANSLSVYDMKYQTLGYSLQVIFIAADEGKHNPIKKVMELERNEK